MEARRPRVIVADTNVLVQFVFDEGSISGGVMLRDADWIAPGLWRSEFRSALSGMIRVGGLSPHAAVEAFERARAIVALEPEPDTPAIVRLLLESTCTAYDLEFVAVALALNVPLVTNDKQVLAEFPGTAISPEAFAA